MNYQDILDFKIISYERYQVSVYQLLEIAVIIAATRAIIWLIHKLIRSRISNGKFDTGRGEALFQIIKYLLIVVAVVLVLDVVGLKLTFLLAGSAALLVGLGLGIQQIFNDVVSGIILLFEGTVLVGDIVEVNGIVGKVKRINIRTSLIETRDRINIIVPNSKLVSDNVINWSHNRIATRFSGEVGVEYGSDVELVKRLREEAVKGHKSVSRLPEPKARFRDFGDSALLFDVLFWSDDMFRIEFIKSDIRTEIDKRFKEHRITIPFPQRDLHIKSNEASPLMTKENP